MLHANEILPNSRFVLLLFTFNEAERVYLANRSYFLEKHRLLAKKGMQRRRKLVEQRFMSIRRHLAPIRKVVRVTSLINGQLTAWRIVADGEKQRWRIEVSVDYYSQPTIFRSRRVNENVSPEEHTAKTEYNTNIKQNVKP